MTARRAAKKRGYRGWHPEDIKAAIRKQDITVSALAERNGLSPSALRESIHSRPIPAADTVIANFLDLPKHALWPDRYGKDEQPLYPHRKCRSTPKNTGACRLPHRETSVAR